MNKPLAIVAPSIGVRSETFIRRHMQDLLPNGTVIVTRNIGGSNTGHWNVDCPVLNLKNTANNFVERTINSFAQKLYLYKPKIGDPTSLALKRFLKKHEVQIVMGEYLNFSLNFLDIAHELNIPFFVHAHGRDISALIQDPKWQKEYLRYNQSAGIITMSQASQRRLIELGLDPTKVYVIPYGTDVPDKPWTRIDHNIIRCFAVGRMVPKKAPIFLLAAFRQAADVCPYLHLDYVGTGELLPAVRQFVQAFNLANSVTIHEGQPSEVVQQLMKEANIFLQHSITDPDSGDEEGLPVAILEAMANALPVVSTRHAGIPEAVLDGKTGFLVDEGDCSSMAHKILLLAQNSALRSKMGTAAWQRAKELYTWQNEKTRLLEVMQLSHSNTPDSFAESSEESHPPYRVRM